MSVPRPFDPEWTTESVGVCGDSHNIISPILDGCAGEKSAEENRNWNWADCLIRTATAQGNALIGKSSRFIESRFVRGKYGILMDVKLWEVLNERPHELAP